MHLPRDARAAAITPKLLDRVRESPPGLPHGIRAEDPDVHGVRRRDGRRWARPGEPGTATPTAVL